MCVCTCVPNFKFLAQFQQVLDSELILPSPQKKHIKGPPRLGLTDHGSEDKKAKDTKEYAIKRKLKFENFKNCLEASHFENKISYLGNNKNNIDSLKKKHKQFIRNNKSILKTLQRFKSEGRNVFTEKINKIVLSSNDDKRTQSTDWIKAYAYGTSTNPVSELEEIKCNNITKPCKK